MKRVKIITEKPNPLFETWLEHWITQAASKGSSLEYYLSKALESLRKYPLLLKSGKECLILENFNLKLCSILDKKIHEWQMDNIRLYEENQSYVHNAKDNSSADRNNSSENFTVSKKCPSSNDHGTQTKNDVPKSERYLISNKNNSILLENLFDIILLVDVHEVGRKKTAVSAECTSTLLTQLGTMFEIRHLNIGDFAWIAKCRLTHKEFIIPYIVERKRFDDLSSSMRDGRYKKQKVYNNINICTFCDMLSYLKPKYIDISDYAMKRYLQFRLRHSGIENLIYVIEKHNKQTLTSIPLSSLMQATVNVLLRDGFIVQHTNNHKSTLTYLNHMTNVLTNIYKEKCFTEKTRKFFNLYNPSISLTDLMPYMEFYRNTSKRINITVREMFVRHLIRLWGISIEIAVTITDLYPTPYLLTVAINACEAKKGYVLESISFKGNGKKITSTTAKNVCQLYLRKKLP